MTSPSETLKRLVFAESTQHNFSIINTLVCAGPGWHKTFEAMEAAVSAVLDHLEKYQAELTTLMTEKFQRHPRAKVVAEQSVAT